MLPRFPIIGGKPLDDGGAAHTAFLHEGKELHAETAAGFFQTSVEYTWLLALGSLCQITFLSNLVTQGIGLHILG